MNSWPPPKVRGGRKGETDCELRPGTDCELRPGAFKLTLHRNLSISAIEGYNLSDRLYPVTVNLLLENLQAST